MSCTHKLLSGSISVSVTTCSKDICVSGQNLYTLQFGNIQDEMSWKQRSQGQSHIWILNLRTYGGLCLKVLLTHLFRPWFNKALSKLSNQHHVLWAFDRPWQTLMVG